MNNSGRVKLKNEYEKPFKMMEDLNDKDTYGDTLKYYQTENLLSKVYFSKENI